MHRIQWSTMLGCRCGYQLEGRSVITARQTDVGKCCSTATESLIAGDRHHRPRLSRRVQRRVSTADRRRRI